MTQCLDHWTFNRENSCSNHVNQTVHVFQFTLLLFEREHLCRNSLYGLIAVLPNLSREIKVLFYWTGLPGSKT